MADPVDQTGDGHGDPAVEWYEATPSDVSNLPVVPRCLLIGTAGILRVTSRKGTVGDLPVTVGYNPVRPYKIHSTGTTAADIWCIY